MLHIFANTIGKPSSVTLADMQAEGSGQRKAQPMHGQGGDAEAFLTPYRN